MGLARLQNYQKLIYYVSYHFLSKWCVKMFKNETIINIVIVKTGTTKFRLFVPQILDSQSVKNRVNATKNGSVHQKLHFVKQFSDVLKEYNEKKIKPSLRQCDVTGLEILAYWTFK